MSLTGKDLVVIAKKHPIGIGCALLSLALLVFGYLRSGKLEEAQTRLDELTATANRLKANINYSVQLEPQLVELTRAVDSLKSSLMDPAALAQNLQYFYKIEAESGVTLGDLRQLNPINPTGLAKGAKPPFVNLPFTVSAQGDFRNVMTFLRKLENGDHFSRITAASIRPAASRSNVTLTLSVELLAKP